MDERRRIRNRQAGAVAVIAIIGAVLAACSPIPAGSGPLCKSDELLLTCAHNSTILHVAGEERVVHWQVPKGTPPADGWPVVIMFQGSIAKASMTWISFPGAPAGLYYQTQVVQQLLENGFAVLTPETHLAGLTFWDTNNPLVSDYYASADHALMRRIFSELEAGTFGDVNAGSLYATGISSGGYMTSRMAITYPGKFKALAIQSASYATCLGPICDIGRIPEDHPPTLFLHGNQDPIVPIWTMYPYDTALRAKGIETEVIVDNAALHEWIPQAPEAVLEWFRTHG